MRILLASLVRKPGAFVGDIFREELFPRPSFWQANDQLARANEPKADHHCLGLLALAVERGEDEVAAALGHREGAPPILTSFTPELNSYGALMAEVSA